jgi:hypothetical protein
MLVENKKTDGPSLKSFKKSCNHAKAGGTFPV